MLFKHRFYDAIRRGTKTQTIRLWRQRPPAAGSMQRVAGLGCLRITAVDEIRLSDLTEDDAILDGFASLADLRMVIDECYGAGDYGGKRWYRIRFAYVGHAPTPLLKQGEEP